MVKPSKKLERKLVKFEKKVEKKSAAAAPKAPKAESATLRKAVTSAGGKKKKAAREVKPVMEAEEEAAEGTSTKEERLEKLKQTLKKRKEADKWGSGAAGLLAKNYDSIAAHAAAEIQKKGGSTVNLASGRRHDVFVSELNQFNTALAVPQFQADPFGAIEAHISSTASILKAQTSDVGRKAGFQERQAALNKHASWK
jgi:hypothetical protein